MLYDKAAIEDAYDIQDVMDERQEKGVPKYYDTCVSPDTNTMNIRSEFIDAYQYRAGWWSEPYIPNVFKLPCACTQC